MSCCSWAEAVASTPSRKLAPEPGARRAPLRARQPRDREAGHVPPGRRRGRRRARRRSRATCASTSSSSARRRRSCAGLRTPCARPASPSSGRAGTPRARGLEGVREGRHGGGRRARRRRPSLDARPRGIAARVVSRRTGSPPARASWSAATRRPSSPPAPRRRGGARPRLVIEELLEGPEVSLLRAVAGGEVRAARAARRTSSASATATTGPNTGGMGAYSPVPGLRRRRGRELVDSVHVPVLRELARRGTHFRGLPLRRADADRRRPAGARVQLPLRRSRGAGAPAAARRRPAGAPRGDRRPARCAERAFDTRRRRRGHASCWRRAATPPPSDARRRRSTASRTPRRPARSSSTPAPRCATGALATAGGRVLAVSALGTTRWPRRASGPTPRVERIRFDGAQHRTDIALAAAGREAARPDGATSPRQPSPPRPSRRLPCRSSSPSSTPRARWWACWWPTRRIATSCPTPWPSWPAAASPTSCACCACTTTRAAWPSTPPRPCCAACAC